MATIDREVVERVAEMARLALTEEEIELFRAQLGSILEYAKAVDELDTEGVEPTAHAVALQNVLRDDVARPSLPKEAVLGNAPEAQDGCFRVPRIMEE